MEGHDLWIGDRYRSADPRVLVLGESWYDTEERLAGYIPRWARGEVRDATFSRLFNACSGRRVETSDAFQRLEWWHTIAFYNFVPGTVGETRRDRPTRAHFEAARAPLGRVLAMIRPHGVWILGKEQAEHSALVVSQHGLLHEVTPHPTSYGVATEALRASWTHLHARIVRTERQEHAGTRPQAHGRDSATPRRFSRDQIGAWIAEDEAGESRLAPDT